MKIQVLRIPGWLTDPKEWDEYHRQYREAQEGLGGSTFP